MVTIIVPKEKGSFNGPNRDLFFLKRAQKRINSRNSKEEDDTGYFDLKVLFRVEALLKMMKKTMKLPCIYKIY